MWDPSPDTHDAYLPRPGRTSWWKRTVQELDGDRYKTDVPVTGMGVRDFCRERRTERRETEHLTNRKFLRRRYGSCA